MKTFFTSLLKISLLILPSAIHAQCPGGEVPEGVAYDTTIATPAGINTMQVRFPQFDPQQGMVTCVRLCITITGVVDSVSVENNSASPQSADIYYIRTDQLTGPGLLTPLTNSVNQHYGPFALAGSNGILGSGPDFVSIRDTVLNAHSVCRTLNDSISLSQFYGVDSVTYTYNISAFTNVSCTGGNYNSTVVTSAFVNFRFEYCTCPGVVLPLNIRDFSVVKIEKNRAELRWETNETPGSDYSFEIEVSRNGRDYRKFATVNRNGNGHGRYKKDFKANGGSGQYYFRIKQVYQGGYTRFSEIRQVNMESYDFPEFNIFPNPSTGIVGIKFDNISSGNYHALFFNAQGQKVAERVVSVSNDSYRQVATLKPGIYWLKLIDLRSKASCVSQILIK